MKKEECIQIAEMHQTLIINEKIRLLVLRFSTVQLLLFLIRMKIYIMKYMIVKIIRTGTMILLLRRMCRLTSPNSQRDRKKMLELRLKRNETRKANQTAMVAEKKRMEAPPESKGVSKEKWIEERKKKIGKLLDSNGLDMTKAYMLVHRGGEGFMMRKILIRSMTVMNISIRRLSLYFCNQALYSKRGETTAAPKILLPFLKGTMEKPITATI
ncbi:hypothetical protein ACSBR2_026512 [Camellia fascicularis]